MFRCVIAGSALLASLAMLWCAYSVWEYTGSEIAWRTAAYDSLNAPQPKMTRFYRSGHAAGRQR